MPNVADCSGSVIMLMDKPERVTELDFACRFRDSLEAGDRLNLLAQFLEHYILQDFERGIVDSASTRHYLYAIESPYVMAYIPVKYLRFEKASAGDFFLSLLKCYNMLRCSIKKLGRIVDRYEIPGFVKPEFPDFILDLPAQVRYSAFGIL